MKTKTINIDQITLQKDDACMAKGDSYEEIPTYIKHWEEAKTDGWEIRILSETGLKTIRCKWKNYRRSGLLREEKKGACIIGEMKKDLSKS